MNQIKIIKKNANAIESQPPKISRTAITVSNFERRDVAETIEDWIANWRRGKETEKQRAFDKLTRLGLKNSV